MKQYQLDKVSIRLVEEPPLLSDEPLDQPEKLPAFLKKQFGDMDREIMAVVNLHANLAPINMSIVSIGTNDHTIACPRDMLKSAILSNASCAILVHNHPSGNLTPSQEDIQLTDQIQKAFSLLGMRLVDSIIVGPCNRYFSFFENRSLPFPDLQLSMAAEDVSSMLRKQSL